MAIFTEQDIKDYEQAIYDVASGDYVTLLYIYEPQIDPDWGTLSGDRVISGCNVTASIQPMYFESEDQLKREGVSQETIGVVDRTQKLGFFMSGDMLTSGDTIITSEDLDSETYSGDNIEFNASMDDNVIKVVSHNNIIYEIVDSVSYRAGAKVFGYEVYLKKRP